MRLLVYPPDGFSLAGCYPHLKAVVRIHGKSTVLRRSRRGYFTLAGPGSQLIMLKMVLSHQGYVLPSRPR